MEDFRDLVIHAHENPHYNNFVAQVEEKINDSDPVLARHLQTLWLEQELSLFPTPGRFMRPVVAHLVGDDADNRTETLLDLRMYGAGVLLKSTHEQLTHVVVCGECNDLN